MAIKNRVLNLGQEKSRTDQGLGVYYSWTGVVAPNSSLLLPWPTCLSLCEEKGQLIPSDGDKPRSDANLYDLDLRRAEL